MYVRTKQSDGNQDSLASTRQDYMESEHCRSGGAMFCYSTDARDINVMSADNQNEEKRREKETKSISTTAGKNRRACILRHGMATHGLQVDHR